MLPLVAGCDRAKEASAAPVAAASQPAGAMDGSARVGIDNFAFTPAEVRVRAGTRVTWVNHDDVPHTVTAVDKSFGSKAMDTDEQFSRVFDRPGTYPYFCAVHTHMTGRVVVVEK
jgi:plastocyanin